MTLWMLLACAAEPEPVERESGDTGDPATIALAGSCPQELRFGGFEVSVGDLYSSVSGSLADGVVPITILAEELREGECVLLRRDNPRCEPTCEAEETCDFSGECIPYPVNQNLGEVRITGLLDAVSMQATQPNNGYFDTTLPHPVVAPDALVTLSTEGGAFPPFTLHGVGPEPLVLGVSALEVSDEALVLGWTPPAGLGRSTVELRLNVDQHGLSPLTLVCTFADDGEGEVPPALLRELLVRGVSGWPSARVSRQTLDSRTVGTGCVELRVGEDRMPDVSVVGHTPCDGHDDCPFGQHCNFALETCE